MDLPVACHATRGYLTLPLTLKEEDLLEILTSVNGRTKQLRWTGLVIPCPDKERPWRILGKIPVYSELHTFLFGCWQRLMTRVSTRSGRQCSVGDEPRATAQRLWSDPITGGHEDQQRSRQMQDGHRAVDTVS